MSEKTLVLASTSPFRRELLGKLRLPFECAAPDIDESARPGETPEQLVMRLAEAKARAVADNFGEALIIGSDQVACTDGEILGKPGNRGRAILQLENTSGKTVDFYTGLSVLDTATDQALTLCEPFKVHFRQLGRGQIERYLDAEEPYNCAGSFKSEGFGITLFERLEGDDPNTLIGLPLIRLVDLLAAQGVHVP